MRLHCVVALDFRGARHYALRSSTIASAERPGVAALEPTPLNSQFGENFFRRQEERFEGAGSVHDSKDLPSDSGHKLVTSWLLLVSQANRHVGDFFYLTTIHAMVVCDRADNLESFTPEQ